MIKKFSTTQLHDNICARHLDSIFGIPLSSVAEEDARGAEPSKNFLRFFTEKQVQLHWTPEI